MLHAACMQLGCGMLMLLCLGLLAGSHLFIDLRASLSLGMSLSATLELVYCGAPSSPLYKELPSFYSQTDR